MEPPNSVQMGDLMRVISVDEMYGVVLGKIKSGRTARVTGLTGALPIPGDLIRVRSDAWVIAPAEAWARVPVGRRCARPARQRITAHPSVPHRK